MSSTWQLQICFLLLLPFLHTVAPGYHSERWQKHYRSKRDASSTWQDSRNFPQCTLSENLTKYDAMGRRESDKLVVPGHQGACGSCWAFAMAHAFADHLRLNDMNSSASFSVDHLTKCHKDAVNGNGCCGSDLVSALHFLNSTGAYTEQCLPYSLAKFFKLRYRDNSLTCPNKCKDKSRLGTPMKLLGFDCIEEESQVMQALQNGTVIAIFSITDTGAPLSHAVEIVDYSSSSYSGPAFWVVKNSYGKDWGENGYFRIKRDSNLLDIFFSLRINTPTSTVAPDPTSVTVCGAQNVLYASRSELVTSSTEYAVQELNTNKSRSLSCSNSSSLFDYFRARPTITSFEIWNATEQAIEGMLLVIEAHSNFTGCPKPTTAALHLVVMVNMDSSFELIDYSYNPVSARAATVSLVSAASLLMVAIANIVGNF